VPRFWIGAPTSAHRLTNMRHSTTVKTQIIEPQARALELPFLFPPLKLGLRGPVLVVRSPPDLRGGISDNLA